MNNKIEEFEGDMVVWGAEAKDEPSANQWLPIESIPRDRPVEIKTEDGKLVEYLVYDNHEKSWFTYDKPTKTWQEKTLPIDAKHWRYSAKAPGYVGKLCEPDTECGLHA